MAKTITDQINDLEQENLKLKELESAFEKMIRSYFSCSVKDLKNYSFHSNFITKVSKFYGLKSEEDFKIFYSFCMSENQKNHYEEFRNSHKNS